MISPNRLLIALAINAAWTILVMAALLGRGSAE